MSKIIHNKIMIFFKQMKMNKNKITLPNKIILKVNNKMKKNKVFFKKISQKNQSQILK